MLDDRISYELSQPQGTDVYINSEDECRPRVFSPTPQCQHVQADCPWPATVLGIDQSPPPLFLHRHLVTAIGICRPGILAHLFFSTLGISASDFFTTNLATLAQMLGLDKDEVHPLNLLSHHTQEDITMFGAAPVCARCCRPLFRHCHQA